jgi:CelD/BcsL family acetyltransferase involved in cellulose biosynthesis
MNVVALRRFPAESRPLPVDCVVAEAAVHDSIAAAEGPWRALEGSGSLATPYQGYDFLNRWQAHLGVEAGITPAIVVAYNQAEIPLFLLPLGARRLGGLRVLEFLGGKHANFNMGLWRRDFAASVGAPELRAVLRDLAARADLALLTAQPLTWDGATNPLALLPHQRSANNGFSGALIHDFDALFRARTNSAARKKMKKKERDLAAMGEVRFERAGDARQVHRALDTFFKQKSARMRLLGLPDVFAEPGVRRFIAAASEPKDGRPAPIELYTLSVDDMIVATMGGIVAGGRFCAMFNSIQGGRYAAESPGEQLIVRLVKSCCERGLGTFDLGVGQSRYKHLFCEDSEPLFDSYLPLTAAAQLPALGFRLAGAAKRVLKEHPALWSIVRTSRRLRGRIASLA